MDVDIQKVRDKIGHLSDAIWRRASSGESGVIESLSDEYRPETRDEIAVWDDLTSPQNYAMLLCYVDYWADAGTDLCADRLHRAILREATRRFDFSTEMKLPLPLG